MTSSLEGSDSVDLNALVNWTMQEAEIGRKKKCREMLDCVVCIKWLDTPLFIGLAHPHHGCKEDTEVTDVTPGSYGGRTWTRCLQTHPDKMLTLFCLRDVPKRLSCERTSPMVCWTNELDWFSNMD